MTMKPDQERVRGLLTDTVTLLCKNGLQYSKELKVQGLLGITLDNDDVFVVHINEIFDGLVGGQVSGIQSGDGITSAIVAADSATQPIEREPSVGKSRKSTPHKHGIPRTSSPMLQGSSKRKASLKAPVMRIKKEDDDDVVVMDSAKNEADNTTEFIPASADLSGDGDREAMRMSYGGVSELDNEAPPAKRRASDSKGNDSFSDQTDSVSGAPFITGIVRNNTESDMLGQNSSLDGSQLSQMGDGQVVFDNTPGCSAWDSSQLAEGNGDSTQDPGSQDSMAAAAETAARSEVLAASTLQQESAQIVDVKNETDSFVQVFQMAGSHDHEYISPQPVEMGMEEVVHMIRGSTYRKPRSSEGKEFICYFENCKCAYHHKKDLIRHIRAKHMKSKGEVKVEEFLMKLQEKKAVSVVTRSRSPKGTTPPTFTPSKPTTRRDTKIQEESDVKIPGVRRGKSKNKPFPCQFKDCHSSYYHNRDLNRHIRFKHLKEGFMMMSYSPKGTGEPKAYTCGYQDCGKSYHTYRDTLKHFNSKHPNCQGPPVLSSARSIAIKTKNYVCPAEGCGLSFMSKRAYTVHARQAHKERQTEVIEMVLAEPQEPEELFRCEEVGCDNYFPDIYLLLEHYKKDHGHLDAYIQEQEHEMDEAMPDQAASGDQIVSAPTVQEIDNSQVFLMTVLDETAEDPHIQLVNQANN